MSKEIGQIKITKTDNGFALNFEGDFSGLGCNCCCDSEQKAGASEKSCCESTDKKSE